MAATRRLSPSGDVGPLGVTDEYTDSATGFVYLWARWYWFGAPVGRRVGR